LPKLSFEIGLAVFGLVFTIILVVLDKAEKLKGPALYWLLALAAVMTLPLVLGNPILAEASGLWKYWLRALAVSIVALTYWAIGIWIYPTQAKSTIPESSQPHDAARDNAAAKVETRAAPTRKTSPEKSNPVPAPKGPRLGMGSEAYKDIDDAQVGEWAMEEADKIAKLVTDSMKYRDDMNRMAPNMMSYDALVWRFNTDFNDCCAQDVKELRAEILQRLPLEKDPKEIQAWTVLFLQNKYPNVGIPDTVNPSSVRDYAPYLRRLGLRLKRRQIPRLAPKSLHFSEESAPSTEQNVRSIIVTITTGVTVSAGYIVVEFEGLPYSMDCDFVGSKLLPNLDELMENQELSEYLQKFPPIKYALEIGKNAFVPEKPVHVRASGAKPIHAAKVTLFDL
jgi:hypothetical protein